MWRWLACAGAPSGAGESLQIRGGDFVEGALPSGGTSEVAYVASPSFIVQQGQAAAIFTGAATDDAWAVAVSLPGAPRATGYWAVPVTVPDPAFPGTLTFQFTAAFADDTPFGPAPLEVVAVDGEGRGGPVYEAPLCVLPDVADRVLTACDPSLPPPHTILSLRWDRPVDLDLVVVTPSGKVVNPKAPTTADDEGGDGLANDLDAPGVGQLTRDANGGCTIDGSNLESLVFLDAPEAGAYRVYADLWSACGQPAAIYTLTLYEALEPELLVTGQVLAAQASRGATLGTHLATLQLPR